MIAIYIGWFNQLYILISHFYFHIPIPTCICIDALGQEKGGPNQHTSTDNQQQLLNASALGIAVSDLSLEEEVLMAKKMGTLSAFLGKFRMISCRFLLIISLIQRRFYGYIICFFCRTRTKYIGWFERKNLHLWSMSYNLVSDL